MSVYQVLIGTRTYKNIRPKTTTSKNLSVSCCDYFNLSTMSYTYCSESRHLSRHQYCSCSDTKSDTTEEPNHETQHEFELHKIHEQLNNPKHQSIENKKPEHQNIPMEFYEQNIASDKNIPWKLINNPIINSSSKDPNYLIDDPRRTEALLKQIWLSHQLGKVQIPQGQNPNFNTEIRQTSILEIPLAKYGVDKEKTNISSLRVIPLDEYGEEHKTNVHDPSNHQKYISYDYSVPYEYNSKAIPDNEFRSNHYYDMLKLDNQRSNLPVYQQNIDYGNFDNNKPYKYDLNKIFDKKRSPIPAAYISYNIPSTQQESGNFCEWILEQTEMLDSENQGLENVDPSGLRYSVLQSLCDSGMHITNNGILVDTYGTVSSLDSLNFTSIIIGNSMSLRQLLEGKHEGMSLKLQTPYLEAILVSATHPLKILGIIPLGTTYLPLPTLSNVANIMSSIPNDQKSGKFWKDGVENENDLEQKEFEKPKVNKSKESNSDNTDERYNNPVQSSNNVNVNGNNNRFGLSRRLKTIQSRRGLRPEDDDTTEDHPYSKQFKAVNKEEEPESSGGRIFIPRIKVQEQPIDMLTRRRHFPVTVLAPNIYKPARIHIPSISNFLDIAFGSEKASATRNQNTKSNTAISENPAESSGDIEKSSKTTDEPLTEPNLFKDVTPMSVGENIELNNFFQIVGDNAKSIFKLNKKRLKAILDKTDLSKITQYLPLFENLDVGSRSGDALDLSEIPPENVHNGNSPFDLVKNDDDDDDGDFRIIGGNAATGSGTPLSNKGRSGYIF